MASKTQDRASQPAIWGSRLAVLWARLMGRTFGSPDPSPSGANSLRPVAFEPPLQALWWP